MRLSTAYSLGAHQEFLAVAGDIVVDRNGTNRFAEFIDHPPARLLPFGVHPVSIIPMRAYSGGFSDIFPREIVEGSSPRTVPAGQRKAKWDTYEKKATE